MRLIDADALERDGWTLQRTRQQDKETMVYEVKKPSDFPTIEERKTGKWIRETKHYKDAEQEFYYYEERCSECGTKRKIGWGEVIYCPICGVRMESC